MYKNFPLYRKAFTIKPCCSILRNDNYTVKKFTLTAYTDLFLFSGNELHLYVFICEL